MSIKLICFEPWNGNNLFENDSGFGNRISSWMFYYHLSTIIKDIEIVVEENYWPELLLIDLPNTTSKNISSLKLSKDQLIPISSEEFSNIILTDGYNTKFSENNYYYFDFIWDSQEVFDVLMRSKRLTYYHLLHNSISKIKLKSFTAFEFFENQFSDFCCIHLRRGLGTFPTKKFLNEINQVLTKKMIDSYLNDFHLDRLGRYKHLNRYHYYDVLLVKDTDTERKDLNYQIDYQDFTWVNTYKIIPDSDYFNLIDNFILSENPDQKIYISSDIPKKYYSYYYDRYPDNIVDKIHYFRKFIDFYRNQIPTEKLQLKYSISIAKTFENVFDLMVGCHSKIIVRSASTWIDIPACYKKKKVISADKIVRTNSLGNWTLIDYKNEVDWLSKMSYNQFCDK